LIIVIYHFTLFLKESSQEDGTAAKKKRLERNNEPDLSAD
jgi:hypothetical protein